MGLYVLQAKEALNDAQSVDRASAHTNFLFYKLALMEAEMEAGTAYKILVRCY